MGFESSEVRVTGTGHVYVAPVGSDFPASVSEPVAHADGWVELGYASEDGARFSFGREVNEIMAWQSFDPIAQVVTRVPKTVSFDLMQWNQHTVKLALGGGSVTELASGEYEYQPPDESFRDERALVVEGIDGNYTYRFCYRKAINEEGVEFAFVRENPVLFPITMKILAPDDDASSFFIQTDDPSIGEILEAAS